MFKKTKRFYDIDPNIVRRYHKTYPQPNGHKLCHEIGYDKHGNIVFEDFSEFDEKDRLIKSKNSDGGKYWISEENGDLYHNRVFPDGSFRKLKVYDHNTYDKQYGDRIWY